MAGGLDLDRVEISDKIEVWDEKIDDWRLTSEKVSHPTLRQVGKSENVNTPSFYLLDPFLKKELTLLG